ncbi:hypothetical protein DH2020_006883 [Rehmannia glutinosa]|uniref:Dirigent protein n=1 Tax=Rehmannia glutinosa TaxID=99300 RepID=A0ABR0XK62_REHGL
MAKLITILMLYSLAQAISKPVAHVNVIPQGPEAVQEWFKNLPNAKEKLTKLHFYFHDIVSGKNPSAITVAQSNFTLKSPTGFGLVRMMDDALTIGPEPNSKIIGRAQGIYGSASLEEVGLLMTLNFVFTEGEYNGSTLSVLGHNPVFREYREMPIVGGSGVFRLARGVATAKTVWFNVTSGDAVVEYNVMVLHYVCK